MLHVPFKVFTATVSLIDPNRGIYASALRTLPNAPSPIVPSSRTFSRLISQLSSYGISLPYRYSDKKNPIDTKLNAFDELMCLLNVYTMLKAVKTATVA